MKTILRAITDRVTTKKGMWITLISWLLITCALAIFAPTAKEYEVSSIDSLPEDAKSVIAQEKLDRYFQGSEGIPAILVFQSKAGEIEYANLASLIDEVAASDVEGISQVVPLSKIPEQAAGGFFSEDKTIAVIPVTLDGELETAEIKTTTEGIAELIKGNSEYTLYITGPAGIAADTLNLFQRADLVLLFSTIGLILVLLIIIYRSPLLAIIPLLAAVFVYEVVMQTLGLMGSMGLVYTNQTVSIMSILLFAAVIDYSLFVFSRYREELKIYEDKFEAMKKAMAEVGMPVFFSGGTVLAAMLVLFFAKFGDYRNFAPTFAMTMAIIMVASVTLVPALFTLFGRKSFWPKVPKVGEETVKENAVWSKIARFVVKKPMVTILSIGLLIVMSASNLFNLTYEYDLMKSFPEDMSSRVGYDLLEENFAKGDLAPTTVLFESKKEITKEDQERLIAQLLDKNLVGNVRLSGMTEDQKVINLSLTFEEGPYDIETIDAMEKIIIESEQIVSDSGLEGDLYFSGETASLVDEREVNNRDVLLIVVLETILIFVLLIALTKSFKLPLYMMGTILVSFLAALGLGTFLANLFFDIDTVSNRVPLYSFVFLVALGIDYNIILISRYQEERRKHSVKKAIEIAVSKTGGVISSAGIILAATFAVLMTQPVQLLFVFGFIVAIGILLDTFIIRGFLLPAIIVLVEKDKGLDKKGNKRELVDVKN